MDRYFYASHIILQSLCDIAINQWRAFDNSHIQSTKFYDKKISRADNGFGICIAFCIELHNGWINANAIQRLSAQVISPSLHILLVINYGYYLVVAIDFSIVCVCLSHSNEITLLFRFQVKLQFQMTFEYFKFFSNYNI